MDIEHLELSYTVGGNVNLHSNFGQLFGESIKAIHIPTLWPGKSTSGFTFDKNVCVYSPKARYKNIHNSTNQ